MELNGGEKKEKRKWGVGFSFPFLALCALQALEETIARARLQCKKYAARKKSWSAGSSPDCPELDGRGQS